MLTTGDAFCCFPEPLGSWPNEFSVVCIFEENSPGSHQHLAFGYLEIPPAFGLSSAAAATQAGRRTCLYLTNQNFANTSETFQCWQKSSTCEDAVPHTRSTCVLWQSLLTLLWTWVPQKCQAGAGLLTRTAVGGRAHGLLPRR